MSHYISLKESNIWSEHATYFHIVSGVREVGEGAEGREHSLGNSHQAVWYGNRCNKNRKVSLFFWILLYFFFFYMPTSPSANRKSDSSSPGLSSQLQSTQCKQATENCLLFVIACLLSLPPLSCLSLSAASLTSNLSFSCRFWPLGGGAYV